MKELNPNYYLDHKRNPKLCFFCKNPHANKKYRFWTKSYQHKYWVCAPCIELRGGVNGVLEELEKLPQEVQKLHPSKKIKLRQHAAVGGST